MRLLAFGLVFFIFGSYQVASARANDFRAFQIRTGDNVISLLRSNGFTQEQREQVLARAPGLKAFLLTTDMSYLKKSEGGSVTLKFHDIASDAAYSIQRKGRALAVQRYQPKYTVKVTSHQGGVQGSLMGSLQSKVRSNWVASRFMDAYLLEHDLSSLAKGAKFSFKVEQKYENGVFVKYGEVLATSLQTSRGIVRKEFVRFPGGGVFVNSEDLLSERPLYSPVGYLRIASLFQAGGRRHPVLGRVRPHLGIDFELPEGSPVYATKKGVVVRKGRDKAAGNYLVLLHANGVETSYFHLKRIDSSMREGLVVRTGQKVGEVGCTGWCTRPHLHFAVKSRGRMVNPARLLRAFPPHYERSLEEKVAARD